jgi:hypothetical protein
VWPTTTKIKPGNPKMIIIIRIGITRITNQKSSGKRIPHSLGREERGRGGRRRKRKRKKRRKRSLNIQEEDVVEMEDKNTKSEGDVGKGENW